MALSMSLRDGVRFNLTLIAFLPWLRVFASLSERCEHALQVDAWQLNIRHQILAAQDKNEHEIAESQQYETRSSGSRVVVFDAHASDGSEDPRLQDALNPVVFAVPERLFSLVFRVNRSENQEGN